MRRLISTLVALATVSLGSALAAAPAEAHVTCAYGMFCPHTGVNYGGTHVAYDALGNSSCRTLLESTLNNNIESISTNYSSRRQVKWYNSQNCSGSTVWTTLPGIQKPSLAATATNTISSFIVVSY